MEILRLKYQSAVTALQLKTFVAARTNDYGRKGRTTSVRPKEKNLTPRARRTLSEGGRGERTSKILLRGGRFTPKKF